MNHLACFAAGTLALGVYHGAYEGDESVEKRHMEAAEKLASFCWKLYSSQPSGLAPDSVVFQGDDFKPTEKAYVLRPETVESFFYLWRITKQPKWRERGWAIFQALEENCAVPGWGYVPLLDVTNPKKQDPKGKMHSFMLSETLKYIFLIVSEDDILSIDKFVLNTEAHPLRVQEIIPRWQLQLKMDHDSKKFWENITNNDIENKEIYSASQANSWKSSVQATTAGAALIGKHENIPRPNVDILPGSTAVGDGARAQELINKEEVIKLSEKNILKSILNTTNAPVMAESELLKEMIRKGKSQNVQSYLDIKV